MKILNQTNQQKLLACLYIIFATLSFYMFYLYFFRHEFNNDHVSHVAFARNAAKTHRYLPHFMYQLTLNILTGFSKEYNPNAIAASILLAATVCIKMLLSSMIITSTVKIEKEEVHVPPLLLCLIALFIVSPIMNWWRFPSIYIGQFTPTIWHNPTTIICMPFCVGVILMMTKRSTWGLKAVVAGSLMLALSILTKPNFSIAFLPAIFIMTTLKKLRIIDLLIYSIPACACLAWQHFCGFEATPETNIIIKPFAVWTHYTPHPIFSLLLSLAFPLAFIICFWENIQNKDLMITGCLLTVVSISQYALLAENNHRMMHANFLWGSVPALYILFLACISELFFRARHKGNKLETVKLWVCYSILTLHVISGVVFYIRSINGHDYWA